MRRIASYVYRRLILPFVESTAPIHAVCWGASIGMFLALTPTVGLQMYSVTMIWVVARYGFRLRFNLPIALAITWITNPVTLLPFYYGFLKTGNWALEYWGVIPQVSTYQDFLAVLETIKLANEYSEFREQFVNGILALFWQFGWPMVVGSVFWAIPAAALTYPATYVALTHYRRLQAAMEGISYEEWQRRHVTTNGWW